MAAQSRGLRNNDPGNIRKSTTKWQGMADSQTDPDFVIFTTPQFGVRALAKTLLAYQNEHGLRTVRGIVSRWAPPSENNTAAYIAAVAAGVGVEPDDQIDVDTTAVMLPLVKAVITHENGSQPYSDGVLTEGLRSAGISDAPPKPLHQQTSFVAHAAGAVGLAGAAAAKVAEYAPQVKNAADQLSPFAASPMIGHAVTALLTVGGGLTLLGLASQVLKQRAA